MSLNWSNALSAAGGATAAVGLEGVRATLDQQKIELASQLAEKRQIGAEQRAPGVAAATTTATADATAAATVRNAPGLLDVEIKHKEGIDAAALKGEVEKFKTLAPVKRQEEIDTAVAKLAALSTPETLANARKIALAGQLPSYTLVPQADGTVVMFDVHTGKSTGTLNDADGKPIVRKDPEEMKAAVSVINLANTQLKIAEAAYKADSSSLEPGAKEKATVAWQAAQAEAKQIAAPAYAVLYQKAKIPGVAGKTTDDETPTPAGADIAKLKTSPKTLTASFDAKFGSGAAAKVLAATAPENEEPTVKLAPGEVDPNVAVNERRRAAIAAKEAAELEAKRQERVRSSAANQTSVGLMNTLAR